jgi:hypothetical protein
MNHRWKPGKPGLLLLLLLPLACQRLRSAEEPPSAPAAPSGLSKADIKAAWEIAEKARGFKNLLGETERVVLPGEKVRDLNPRDMVIRTGVEPIAAKDNGEKPREVARGGGTVVVTHYRYKTDETILSTVDLSTRKEVRRVTVAHMPTPLSEDELKMARELASDNAKVKKLVKTYGDRLHMDPLVPRVGEKDPAYGHRLVNLLFRVDSDYLASPLVMVDLTTHW